MSAYNDLTSQSEMITYDMQMEANSYDIQEHSASGWGELPVTDPAASNGSSGWSQGLIDRWDSGISNKDEYKDEDMFAPRDYDGSTTQPGLHSTFAQQVNKSEYDKQTREFTKQAVDALVKSPEYQRVFTRCKLCWCSWSDGKFTKGCPECGGYSMTRTCPICMGKCGSIWRREVSLSHSENYGHWNGECQLPEEEKAGYLQQVLMEPAVEDDIVEGMEQLDTNE